MERYVHTESEEKNMLSVVIPAYNEEAMIAKTASTIENILSDAQIPCELVFVDDGSKDATWAQIQRAALHQGAVSSLSLAVAGILTAILFPLATLFL